MDNIIQHKVKYYECDGMAVTHHSNYLRIMEEARIELLDRAGYGYERMEADGIVSPITEVACKYKSPTKFQEIISVEVFVIEITPLRLRFGYTMKVGERLVCTAESTSCFIENGRLINICDKYPELIKELKKLERK